MNKGIYIVIALPMLLAGWALFSLSIYHGAQGIMGLSQANESPWTMVLWTLFFSFAATATSTFVASKVKFMSSIIVRKIHKYSLIVIAVLFLGYITLGAISGFIKTIL